MHPRRHQQAKLISQRNQPEGSAAGLTSVAANEVGTSVAGPTSAAANEVGTSVAGTSVAGLTSAAANEVASAADPTNRNKSKIFIIQIYI